MKTIPNCPVETALMFLSDRVKIMIVGYLLKESLRPSLLKEKIGFISKNSLNNKLKELESLGVVRRTVIEAVPLRVEYSLTELGKSFYEIISSMEIWGENYKKSM